MTASQETKTPPSNSDQPAVQSLADPDHQSYLQDRQSLEILLEIHEAILSAKDLSTIAKLSLNAFGLLISDISFSILGLLDENLQNFQILAFNLDGVDGVWPSSQTLLISNWLLDLEALARGESVLVHASDEKNLTNQFPEFSRFGENQAFLAVPLRGHQDLSGLVFLSADEPDVFHPGRVRLVQDVARVIGTAIDNYRLLQVEQQNRREAEIMREVMDVLASSVSLNQVLEVILRNISKVVRYDRASLYMLNENAQFQLPGSLLSHDKERPKIFPLDDPIIQELQNIRQPLLIDDLQQDPRFVSWPEKELVRGWIGLPLFVGKDMIGIISLGNLEQNAYRSTDVGVLQVFSDQVAEVLHRARLKEIHSRRTEELELLTAFSFALRHAEGQENILAALMDQVTEIFGANQGTFLLLEKDGSTLVVSFSQNPDLVGRWHTHNQDPLWQVVRTGKVMFIQDIPAVLDQLAFPIYSLLFRGMQSAVLLPLQSTDALFGIMCFTFTERQEFSPEDQRLFTTIGEIAGTALQRAVTLESLEKQVVTRTRHLSTLSEISAVASEPDDVDELLQRMLSLTLDVMNSPAGAIHLIDEANNKLNLAAQVHLPGEILPVFSKPSLSLPFWRNLLNSQEPVILPDLRSDPRVPPGLNECPYPAFLGVPLRTKGQSLGVLSILNESILDYTIEDITLYSTIAEQIGSAVERARLQHQAERAAVAEERQRLARELHDSISQLLYSLVLYAGAGRKVLNHGDLENTAEYLQRIDQTSLQALKEMRLLVYELRPSVFREEGLVGALNRRLQAVEKRTGMNAQLEVEGRIDLDEAVELALYRITEEALNNTLKHAEATRVTVKILAQGQQIDLRVSDNGKGFAHDESRSEGGLGLTGIQERVKHLGGQLEVISAQGQGTTVHVHLEVKE